MAKRKAGKMHRTDKQKEATKHNWIVFQIRGVLALMCSKIMLSYSKGVRVQASKIKNDLKTLLAMVKEENANNKHS